MIVSVVGNFLTMFSGVNINMESIYRARINKNNLKKSDYKSAQNCIVMIRLKPYLNHTVSDHQREDVDTRDLFLDHLLNRPHAERIATVVTWWT